MSVNHHGTLNPVYIRIEHVYNFCYAINELRWQCPEFITESYRFQIKDEIKAARIEAT